ncbi:MAG: hypothetical protein KAT78_05370, partial [Flavobacteriaceae bacterium]|nr:hypothetical protein [Flavobacteriaceae bacterium]
MKDLILTKSKYLILLSKLLIFVFVLGIASCKGNKNKINSNDFIASNKKEIKVDKIVTAANQTERYLPLLKDKKVAIVANQTS